MSDSDALFFSQMLNRGGDDGRVLPPPSSAPPPVHSSIGGVAPPPSSSSSSSQRPASSHSAVPPPPPTEGDLVLFRSCRDRLPHSTLAQLASSSSSPGGGVLDVNRSWYACSDGSGWDVVGPMPSVTQLTSFFWPVGRHDPVQPHQASAAKKNAAVGGRGTSGSTNLLNKNASGGDTLLHIAIKTRSTHVLSWLATDEGLDLNVVNDEGLTPAKCADIEGCGNMYTFYFVLRR